MRKVVALGLSIWLVAGLPALAEGTHFHHPQKGFALDFPEGWEVRENYLGTLVFGYDPKTEARVNICTDEMMIPLSADAYAARGLFFFEQMFTGFKAGAKGKSTVGGEPANWYVFSGKMGKIGFSTLEYFLVRGNTGYAINCSADPKRFASLKPAFEKIVRTFALDPLPAEPALAATASADATGSDTP